MTRALLYARFSSDLQNPRSAEDQLGALRQVLHQRGWTEAGAYTDAGISGSSTAARPGVQALLARALAGGVDVVLVEALDRLSRSQSDTARLFELFSFAGVRLETLSSGQVSELHVGLEGTMNRLFLVELGKKTRRGLVARVEAGFSGGGRCYGYRVDPAAKGVMAIDSTEAAVVRRIFAEYLAGFSPRAIAAALNAEGVPGARGGLWTASSINGDRRAGDGLLHQELYVGVRVFNRRRFRKHPETGRRSGVLNPADQWIRKPAPELRILDDDTWTRAQAKKAALGAAPSHHARRPKRLLSGLVVCGLCGGPMVVSGSGRAGDPENRVLACSRRRETGACTNSVYPRVRDVEARVLAALKERLLRPEMVAEVTRQVHTLEHAAAQAARAQTASAERELEELKRRTAKAWEAYDADRLTLDAFGQRMAEIETRKTVLNAIVAAAGDPNKPAPVALHPKAPEYFRQLVETLATALDGDDPDTQAVRAALRPLIHNVSVTKAPGRGQYELILSAKTKALLGEPGRADVVPLLGAGAVSGQYHHGPILEIAA